MLHIPPESKEGMKAVYQALRACMKERRCRDEVQVEVQAEVVAEGADVP